MKNNEQQIKTVFNGDLDHIFNELIDSGIANNQDRMKLNKYPCKIYTRTRQRLFEKKEVEHHSGHGFFGGNDHTHCTIIQIKYKETQTIIKKLDGKEECLDWLIVPDSWETCIIGKYEECGHTQGYYKEVND